MKTRLFTSVCYVLVAASAFADSYSINIAPGFNLIANQLDNGGNTLNEIIPVAPDQSTIYKFDNASASWEVSIYSASLGSWVPGTIALNPGEGAFFQSPTNFTLTFSGVPNVPVLPVTIPSGSVYLLSRQTNDVGNYTNIVGAAPTDGAVWVQWNKAAGDYTAYSYISGGGWVPSEPTAAVGEAVWIAPAGGSPAPLPTNSFLVYQGLLNESLGNASLTLSGNQLIVTNLGSSGQDGVTIAMPTNATGLVVNWQDLDPSNTLPVGAYIQSQAIGTANGITNGVLGTLTDTKGCAVCDGTNWGISADYSPMGVSNYTVQVFYEGILVAQATNQNGAVFATVNLPPTGKDRGEDAGLSDHWPGPSGALLTLAGGTTSVPCDHLSITLEPFISEQRRETDESDTGLQITASQVPEITITNENVSMVYQGLINTSLGNAALAVEGTGLIVTNLGSSGQDGVSIAMPMPCGGEDEPPCITMLTNHLTGLTVNWQPLDVSNTLPVGAYVQSQALFNTSVLGTLTATKAGTSNYVISADYSGQGASNYMVQAYYEGVLVGQTTVQSGGSAATVNIMPTGKDLGDIITPLSDEWPDGEGVLLTISGGTTSVPCDQLVVSPLGPAGIPPTAFQIAASQVPGITINSEDVSLIYQGLTNTALGSAALIPSCCVSNLGSSGQDGEALIVTNLGSSGQDGVAIALPRGLVGLDVGWDDWDPSNALPVGAYIQSQMVGSAGGITNGVLGTLTETKAGTSNYVISADFSPIGASTYTVQAYDQGVLVAQATNQSGASLAVAENAADTADIEHETLNGWESWDSSVAISVLVGGQEVTCDRLVVSPENVPSPSAVTAFQIVASQISAVTITSENATLLYDGYNVTSLGNAALMASGSQLIVSDIGPSGHGGFGVQDSKNIADGAAEGQAVEGIVYFMNPDPSNSVPVGSYLESLAIGTANGVTNGVLGTLTETKEGTDDYAISANYSPLGASNYTVQVYYLGMLMAQATNVDGAVFATVNVPPMGKDWGDIITPLSDEWPDSAGALVTLAGGTTAVPCDQVVVTPYNVTPPINPTGIQIVVSGIPTLVITSVSESLTYQGLNNTALGSAALAVAGTGLIVTNLGSSGQDGVSVAMPTNATELVVNWQDLDDRPPVGAYIQSKAIGTANGITNGVLGTLTDTKGCAVCDGTNWGVSADYSPMGVSNYTVQVYYEGVLVAQATNQNGAVFATVNNPPTGKDLGDETVPLSDEWPPGGTLLTLAGGTTSVLCDQLVVSPNNVTTAIVSSGFQLVASQIPSLTITSENVTLLYAGFNATSLGNAAVVVSANNFCIISNLGSSGQDGVSLDNRTGAGKGQVATTWNLFDNVKLSILDFDPSNSLPGGAYIQSQVVGTANGITNGFLGTLTATKAGTNFVVSADFSPLGASNYMVAAFNQGVLVAQAMNQSSTSLAVSANSFQTISSLGFGSAAVAGCCISNLSSGGQDGVTIGFTPEPVMIAGQEVTCDQLLFIPEDVTFTNGTTAFQIVASQVPSLTVNAVEVSPLTLNLSQTSQGLSLQWYGTAGLQESADLAAWTDDTNTFSPYAVAPSTSGPSKFYRLIFRP